MRKNYTDLRANDLISLHKHTHLGVCHKTGYDSSHYAHIRKNVNSNKKNFNYKC